VATAFAALLDLALAASLLWPELLTSRGRIIAWAMVVVFWAGSAATCYRADRRRERSVRSPNHPGRDLFAEALDHYVKGGWFEAERLWVELLRRDPHDADTRLMLATMLRHAGRRDEALRQLDRLERLEGGVKWEWEVRRERDRLADGGVSGAEGVVSERGPAALAKAA
jgi:tetratricopeptide (TPR) repeat protein